MGSFLKKDILLIIRDRKELAILVLMPFVLIAILGYALGGLMNDTTPTLNATVAYVNEEDETSGYERFTQEVYRLSVPDDVQEELLARAQQLRPQQLLKGMLQSEQLTGIIQLEELKRIDAETHLKNDKVDVVIIVPANFTYDALSKMLLNSGNGANIEMQLSESSALTAGVVKEIVDKFADNVNLYTAIGQTTVTYGEHDVPQIQGGMEFIAQARTMTSFEYYTFAMIVMFVLYVASSIANRAYTEKREFTYDRIILSGVHPIYFLGGKLLSAFFLVLIQMFVLFLSSKLLFQSFSDMNMDQWFSLIGIALAVAVCVGAVATMLTSINFRLQTYSVSEVFSSVIIFILAFFGGSFLPTSQMADWLIAIGEWTPNGAALASFIQVTQGAEVTQWLSTTIRLLLMAVLLFAVSLWMFPRRRES